jgi:hypothetical protein
VHLGGSAFKQAPAARTEQGVTTKNQGGLLLGLTEKGDVTCRVARNLHHGEWGTHDLHRVTRAVAQARLGQILASRSMYSRTGGPTQSRDTPGVVAVVVGDQDALEC